MRTTLGYILIIAAFVLCIPASAMVFGARAFAREPFIISHISSALVFGIGFYLVTPRSTGLVKKRNLWMAYAFFMALMLPVYGMISSLLIFIMQKVRGQRPPSVVEDEITVQDTSVFSRMSLRSKPIEVLQKLDIEPFIDIFIRGRSEKKKSAIRLLQKVRSKKTIDTLLIALNDDDIEVRLFAAGVIGSIEDEFDKEIKERQLKYRSMPGNTEAALELINFYIDFAESGLPDQIIKEHYYSEAHHILQGLPKKETEVLYLQAKTDLALGEYEEALQHINECLKMDDMNGRYHELHMEVLFEKKDYGSLAGAIANVKARNVQGISNEVMNYWTQEQA